MTIHLPMSDIIKILSEIKYFYDIILQADPNAYINILGLMTYPTNTIKRKNFVFRESIRNKFKYRNEYHERGLYTKNEFMRDITTFFDSFDNINDAYYILNQNNEKSTVHEFKNILCKGYFSGLILKLSIEKRLSPQKTFDFISEETYEYTVSEFDLMTETFKKDSFFNNVWPHYKKVSHFWASWVDFYHLKTYEPDKNRPLIDQHFDSPKLRLLGKEDGFRGFLRSADNYLVRASLYTRSCGRKDQSILDPENFILVLHRYSKFLQCDFQKFTNNSNYW